MNTEAQIQTKTMEQISHYREACDPLQMMGLLMELGMNLRHDLTDAQYKEIAGCHNLLAAIFRNE